jgi:hypothetical protein
MYQPISINEHSLQIIDHSQRHSRIHNRPGLPSCRVGTERSQHCTDGDLHLLVDEIKELKIKLRMHAVIIETLSGGEWDDAIALLQHIRDGQSIDTVYHAASRQRNRNQA